MYDPNQPRIPRHHHGGGRWTRGGYRPLSELGELRPPAHDVDEPSQAPEGQVPYDLYLSSDLDRVRPEHGPQYAMVGSAVPNWAGVGRYVVQKGIEAALAAFAALSAENSRKQQTVISFRAREFVKSNDERGLIILEDLRPLDRETVAKKVCTRLNDVEQLVDRALQKVPHPKDQGNAAFSSAVHKALADEIRELPADPKKVPLGAEVSFVHNRHHVTYGTKGSIRVDVLEYIGNGTVCIYDLKMGNAILDPVRMFQIAKKVFAGYGLNIERIIVTEVRRKEQR